MKEIPLTQGKVAMVDDEDVERLSKHKWCAWWSGRSWYSQTRDRQTKKIVYMHRLVMEAASGTKVDHINQDGLNNQKSNLRICTHAENLRNRGGTKANKSGYKGVCRPTGKNKWRASITLNYRSIYIGEFDTPEAAARAYDAKARELHGEFAVTNFKV